MAQRSVPASSPKRADTRPAARRRPIALVVAVLLLLAVVGGGAILVMGQSPKAPPEPRPVAAPKPGGVMMPDEGRNHVTPGAVIVYKHYPPTSGTHYYIWAPLGVYPAPTFPHPLPEGYWVHNLEHGAIVILYNCPKGCPALAAQLAGLLHTLPNDKHGQVKLIVTPYAHMSHRIAILAWRWIDQMAAFDKTRLTAFYRIHINKGPEDIGPDQYIR